MTFTIADIMGWLGHFLWPFIRVGALMVSAPVFSNVFVPVRVRVLFGVALTIAVMPAVGQVPAVAPLSLQGLLLAAQQVLVGVAMGLIIAMAFQAVMIAGESVGLTMGLGFATMVDPQTGVAVPVISELLLLVCTLLFLALGGHLALVRLLAASFQMLPVAPEGLTAGDFRTVAGWGTQMFAGGVLIALPCLAALLGVNLIVGVMTRAAPQMNLFSVGFPLTMMIGFVVILTLLMPSLPSRMAGLWGAAFATVRGILGG